MVWYVSLASVCRKLHSTGTSSKQLGLDDNVHTQYLVKVIISNCFSTILTSAFLEWLLACGLIALSLFYRITYLSTTERTICKHIQVYLLTCGLVLNVLCFLFSYNETSFVIFLNLMICGRLQGLSYKQTISKHYCFKSLKSLVFKAFLKVCVLSSKL